MELALGMMDAVESINQESFQNFKLRVGEYNCCTYNANIISTLAVSMDSMYTRCMCSVYSQCMCSVYSVYVLSILTVYVLSILSVCAQYTHSVCAQYTQCMCSVYLVYVLSILGVCAQYTHPPSRYTPWSIGCGGDRCQKAPVRHMGGHCEHRQQAGDHWSAWENPSESRMHYCIYSIKYVL